MVKMDSFMGLRISWGDVLDHQSEIRNRLREKRVRRKRVYDDIDLNEWL